ncbi:unnamed protein product [Cylindrotheca closterium]|uniref:Uncharacterized protein n=1 Tax=Cylindrotheca closterium TaxID=2856 RepID=A0AAD2D1F5_9STRA|nr:unnamed protein product [Cylindrotheca closterium]
MTRTAGLPVPNWYTTVGTNYAAYPWVSPSTTAEQIDTTSTKFTMDGKASGTHHHDPAPVMTTRTVAPPVPNWYAAVGMHHSSNTSYPWVSPFPYAGAYTRHMRTTPHMVLPAPKPAFPEKIEDLWNAIEGLVEQTYGRKIAQDKHELEDFARRLLKSQLSDFEMVAKSKMG